VGAAIAAGSHAEKGIWALFVVLAISKIATTAAGKACLLPPEIKVFQDPFSSTAPMLSRRPTSPSRLVRAVSIPALKDLGL